MILQNAKSAYGAFIVQKTIIVMGCITINQTNCIQNISCGSQISIAFEVLKYHVVHK